MKRACNDKSSRRGAIAALRPRVAAAITTLAVAAALAVAAVSPSTATVAASAGSAVTGARQSFADLVERVQPAVVNVSTKTRLADAGMPELPFAFPKGSPLERQFREFFERRFQAAPDDGDAPEARGVGSGFIVDPDGYVVTNNHVIDGADEIVVTLHDGSQVAARVVGRDDKTDLALLKIDHDGPLPYVHFGDSDHARVGDWVVAVGSPFGLGGTVTAGIISARGRDIRSGPFDDFLQVDAPINRGNSGGPLFDQDGEVIGVNTAIFSPSGGNVGIGFAIPSSIAAGVIDSLKSSGRVERGWMGVAVQPLTPELAESFGLDKPRGALVARVQKGSPAEAAGFAAGDVIVEFDGQPIDKMRDLPRIVAAAKAGASVRVKVVRDGKERALDLEVGRLPGDDKVAAVETSTGDAAPQLGVTLAELDGAARSRLGLGDEADGVLIADVASGSPAARSGLRPGDLVLRVGRETVKRPAEVADAVREASKAGRESVVMLVSRNGNERFVAVPFAKG